MRWVGLQTTKYTHKETTCIISQATFIHVYCSSAWLCTTHPQTPCLGTHEPCLRPPFHAHSKRARGWSGCVHSREIKLQGSSMLGSGSWVPSVKTSWICMRVIWRGVFFLVVFVNLKTPQVPSVVYKNAATTLFVSETSAMFCGLTNLTQLFIDTLFSFLGKLFLQ